MMGSLGPWRTNDLVHGELWLDPTCAGIINTPEFQRLRSLQQLGLTSWVFPAATHNRFTHSLGVAFLANKYGTFLRDWGGPEVHIDKQDMLRLQLAGLCHDLGHGPFSHVFEHALLPALTGQDWKHEDMSVQLIDSIMDADGADWEAQGLERHDFAFVKDLILSEPGQRAHCEPAKRYLFDIVANGRNGIDVDKLDYLQRDSHMTGVRIHTSADRIMRMSRVLKGPGGHTELCYKHTEYTNVLDIFQDRAMMHSKVYTHRKVKAVELMVVDALKLVDAELQLSASIQHPATFLRLDDSLLTQVHRLAPDAPHVRQAQALLGRVDRRALYTLAGELVRPATELLKTPRPIDISTHQRQDGLVSIGPEDVAVCESCIDHGMKAHDPMTNVGFWDCDGVSVFKTQVHRNAITTLRPELQCYQERKIRVFCKDPDARKVAAVVAAFQAWCAAHSVRDDCTLTPASSRKRQRPDADPLPVPFPKLAAHHHAANGLLNGHAH